MNKKVEKVMKVSRTHTGGPFVTPGHEVARERRKSGNADRGVDEFREK